MIAQVPRCVLCNANLDVFCRIWLAASIVDALMCPFLGSCLLGLDCF